MRMISKIASGIVLLNLVSIANADNVPISEKEKFSYAVGTQMAQQLHGQSMDLDAKMVSQALLDILSNSKPKLSDDEIKNVLASFQEKRQVEMQKLASENLVTGEAFLKNNKKEKGVETLDNGLQYQVIKAGSGEKPSVSDTVTVHYRGTLITGIEFDSSISRGEPATFPVNGVIQGWQKILPMMPTGSKWKVFIPSELAYGPRGAGANIPPNSALIFEIELLAIKQPEM
ncbi:FKBP-type peptidyl-prolyl cis-trans isomerase FklB [hydrothermal vent metagenome]|uniref:peptidylprolyl isomerase n=1 Tax=hydrothermal vent metagenome TaxID=652676 RepID=A0A3B0ZBY9_9ZZZZ